MRPTDRIHGRSELVDDLLDNLPGHSQDSGSSTTAHGPPGRYVLLNYAFYRLVTLRAPEIRIPSSPPCEFQLNGGHRHPQDAYSS